MQTARRRSDQAAAAQAPAALLMRYFLLSLETNDRRQLPQVG